MRLLRLLWFDIRSKLLTGRDNEAVSIIIPCFNYGHFLKECLDSVFSQTYSNLKVIVIDDGSTDNTKSVSDKYGRRVNYIYQDNQGLSAARNTGLKKVTGSYILFLDADDVLGKFSISKRVTFLKKNKDIDVAICKNYFFKKWPLALGMFNRWKLPKEPIDVAFMHFNIAPIHAYLTRSSCVNESIRFDNKLKACEDYNFWLQLLDKGCKYGLSKGHVFYRKHNFSMSKDTENQRMHDVKLHLFVYHRFIIDECSCSLEKILSFLSGVYITLSRIIYSKSIEKDELDEIVYKILTQIEETGSEISNFNPIEYHYYKICVKKSPSKYSKYFSYLE